MALVARVHSGVVAAIGVLSPDTIVAVDENQGGIGKALVVGLWMEQHGYQEIIRGYVRAWRMGVPKARALP